MNKTVNSQKIEKKFSKLLKKLGAIRISMGKLPTKFQPKPTALASPKKSNIEKHARGASRLGIQTKNSEKSEKIRDVEDQYLEATHQISAHSDH